MKDNKTRTVFQWDITVSGYDLERIISIDESEYITCRRDDICRDISVKVTNETILSYFDTDDENLIHGYLTVNEDDEYEALALLDGEMHNMMLNVPLDQTIDVLKDYFSLNMQDHMSITCQYKNPKTQLYPFSTSEYSSLLFYKTKFRICGHCYSPAQRTRINELLSVMENRNDALYGLADKKLSYIMRINGYNDRNILTFKHTLSKRFTQTFDDIVGNDDAKSRIMQLLEAQEYNNQPLFILLTGMGPKSTIARTAAKAIKANVSFIPIDNYNSEAELLGSDSDASVIVKHWLKNGSTDSVIVLKDFDRFALNNPANAYRLLANFEDNRFNDKFTTAFDTSRSIIIATADETNIPAQILEKFYIVPCDDSYTAEQRRKIVQNILNNILAGYKIDTYNLNISGDMLDELAQEVFFKGVKTLEKNLELFIALNSSQLKKGVCGLTIEDYDQAVNVFKPENAPVGGKLFRRLFDGITEEI